MAEILESRLDRQRSRLLGEVFAVLRIDLDRIDEAVGRADASGS